MKEKIISIFNVAILICLLTACWQDKTISVGDVTGTYLFKYPSGETEILFINKDFTYKKEIYTSYNNFKGRSKPKLSNDGKWSIVDQNELNFDGWLMYNENRYPHIILPEPYKVDLLNVYFYKKSFNTKIATIMVLDESGYVFEMIN